MVLIPFSIQFQCQGVPISYRSSNKVLQCPRLFRIVSFLTGLSFFFCAGFTPAVATDELLDQRVYGEGPITEDHSREFQVLKEKFLLTHGAIDLQKVKQTLVFLSSRREQLRDSIYLAEKDRKISKSGYSDKKATKKSNNEIESGESFLFLYDEAIRSLKDFDDSTSMNTVDRVALFLTAAENFQDSHFLSETLNTLHSIKNFFRKINLDDSQALEASNLRKGGKLLSALEIDALKKQKFDLSTLNPPNGPIWTNNSIENYDPFSEELYPKGKFPDEATEFHYKRMGSGQVKIKAFYYNKKGKEKSVTIKLGQEVRPQLYASQVARILGYSSLPVVYRKRIKLFLGKTSLGEFAGAWDQAHVGVTAGESSRSWFSRAGRYSYVEADHSVLIPEGLLEVYPSQGKYYFKGGAFRSSRHGFVNRREYRALFLYSALVSLVDGGDKNTRMDGVRDKKSEAWRPIFYFNDVGTALGNWYSAFNTMSVNEFGDRLASKNKNRQVRIRYLSRHPHHKSFRTITPSDYRWLIRRMARVQSSQWVDIGTASGLPLYLSELYAEKIKRRINNLIQVFELADLSPVKTQSYLFLARKYPQYISPKGRLLPAADDRDNLAWYGGSSATLKELVQMEISNLGHGALWKKNLVLKGQRSVDINNFHGPQQRRFRVTDTWSGSLPLGSSSTEVYLDEDSNSELYLPVGFHFNYRISHLFSEPSLKQANTVDYSKVLLPWKTMEILEKLKVGESVHFVKSLNSTVGGLKGQLSDQVRLQLDLLRYLEIKLFEVYIHRYSEDELEVVILDKQRDSLRSGIDLKFFLELALLAGQSNQKSNYNFYRLELGSSNKEANLKTLNKIFSNGEVSLADSDNIQALTKIEKDERIRHFRWKFLLWDSEKEKVTSSYTLTADEDPESQSFENLEDKSPQIFSSVRRKISSKRISSAYDFGNFTDSDVDHRNVLDGLSLFWQFFDKQERQEISVFLKTDSQVQELQDLMVHVQVVRGNNYIKRESFANRYLQYFSRLAGEDPENYFSYRVPVEGRYFSPVTGRLFFQIGFGGIQKILKKLNRQPEFCKDSHLCQLGLHHLNRLVSSTEALLSGDVSREDRKNALKKNLDWVSSFFEFLVRYQGYGIRDLRNLAGDKNIWLITSLRGVLKKYHPFAENRDTPVYGTEIGQFQGFSPYKDFSLNNQILPAQNLFFDNLVPQVDY